MRMVRAARGGGDGHMFAESGPASFATSENNKHGQRLQARPQKNVSSHNRDTRAYGLLPKATHEDESPPLRPVYLTSKHKEDKQPKLSVTP